MATFRAPLAIALLLATASARRLQDSASSADTFSGDGTAYSEAVTDGSGFACSYRFLASWARHHFVAINAAQWDGGQSCGKCVSVQCVDSRCTTRNQPVMLMVVDKCPECAHGALDLSIPAYREVTGIPPNRLTLSWSWTECAPVNGTIRMQPKDGGNPYWSAYYISNAQYPLKSVQINGVELARAEFGFWTMSAPLGAAPYAVELEAVNGKRVSATTDKMLEAQDLGVQFQAGGVPVAAAG